ncbi:MAG: ABC transporter permease [Bacteroidales bacterium]|nr:ABC transporter permease [Bacteroidales bacterium]
MDISLKIALRYLFAKKSHNVINVITLISMIGMAVGTAALVVIMSVFNGFNKIVDASLTDLDPDFKILPREGKAFLPDEAVFSKIYDDSSVATMCSVLEDNVFLSYNGKQSLAKAKGVDSVYEDEAPIAAHVINGQFQLHSDGVPRVVMGAALAWSLGANPAFLTPLEIYYPTRSGNISPANPLGSVHSVKARPSGLFTAGADVDASLVILPLETLRELFEYDEEVSAVEIRAAEGLSKREMKALEKRLRETLGDGFILRDRRSLNDSIYRMMRYEKLAIYMILIFIIIIIAFNVLSSQTMLIIEKSGDIDILHSLGAPRSMLRRIFRLEGYLVTLIGLAAGLVAGIALVLLQQHFGFIKMPGNYLIDHYPVALRASDLLWTVAGVTVIGYIISFIPVRSIK